MTDNVQNLPAGLSNRAAAAAAEPVQASPVDAGPALPAQQPATPPAQQQPAAQPAQPAQPAAQPANTPEPPPVPTVPEANTQDVPKSVADLAGALASNNQLAPAVSYLDAIFKDNGLDVARALGQAADELDPRFIDKGYLIEKLGAEKANTIIKVAEDSIKYAAHYVQESLNAVYSTAGGEQQFRAAVQVFNEKADPVERELLAGLLDSGDRSKMQYAAQRIAQYGVQAGVVIQHNAPAIGAPGSQQGLSKEAYLQAISERNVTPEKYEQLKQMRILGMQQGL